MRGSIADDTAVVPPSFHSRAGFLYLPRSRSSRPAGCPAGRLPKLPPQPCVHIRAAGAQGRLPPLVISGNFPLVHADFSFFFLFSTGLRQAAR